MGATEGDQPARPTLIEVRLGDSYYWALSRGRTAVVVLLALLFISSAWVVSQAIWLTSIHLDWLIPPANVGLAISGVFLGVAIAPVPRPADFTTLAVVAVDDVAELRRSTGALIDDLSTLMASDELGDKPATVAGLLRVEQELRRQSYQLIREISRWATISPGSADEIVKNRLTSEAMLKKLDNKLDGKTNE